MIRYCPTEAMLADFFTKPLQGNLFHRLREVIMEQEHVNKLKEYVNKFPSQERVGSGKCEDENLIKSRTNEKDLKTFLQQ
jgi:hypothetical protein